jgi:ferric-dicitrate binding protein FerR (iron transport regulator)
MRERLRNSNTSTPSATSATPSTDLKRRRFLLTLSAGGASAAAAAVVAPNIAAAQDTVATATTDTAEYRETEHVRDYYRTTRI